MSNQLVQAIYQISEGLRMLGDALGDAPQELLQEPKTAKKKAAPKKERPQETPETDNEPPVSPFAKKDATVSEQPAVTQEMIRDYFKVFAQAVGAQTAPQQAKAILTEIGVESAAEASPDQLRMIYAKMHEVANNAAH